MLEFEGVVLFHQAVAPCLDEEQPSRCVVLEFQKEMHRWWKSERPQAKTSTSRHRLGGEVWGHGHPFYPLGSRDARAGIESACEYENAILKRPCE